MSTLVVLAFSARGACAQDSLVFKGADRETRAALATIVAEASARGLPTAPIVSKVQFALVVHAPSARIVATAKTVADRLSVARDAIATDTLSADIANGEDALSFRIPKEILTRIHVAAPNSRSCERHRRAVDAARGDPGTTPRAREQRVVRRSTRRERSGVRRHSAPRIDAATAAGSGNYGRSDREFAGGVRAAQTLKRAGVEPGTRDASGHYFGGCGALGTRSSR
jgi:hypothetical protein